jgi:hypothetical protein
MLAADGLEKGARQNAGSNFGPTSPSCLRGCHAAHLQSMALCHSTVSPNQTSQTSETNLRAPFTVTFARWMLLLCLARCNSLALGVNIFFREHSATRLCAASASDHVAGARLALDGPMMHTPRSEKRLPWTGQSHDFSAGFQHTTPLRWGQRALILCTSPSSLL